MLEVNIKNKSTGKISTGKISTGKKSTGKALLLGAGYCLGQILMSTPMAYATSDNPSEYEIPSGDLGAALQAYIKQSGTDLIYIDSQVKGIEIDGVKGVLTAKSALDAMLAGTGLELSQDQSGAFMVYKPTPSPVQPSGKAVKLSQVQQGATPVRDVPTQPQSQDELNQQEDTVEDDEEENIIVTGTRLENVETTSQTIVFDRAEIDRRGFTSVSDILRGLPQSSGSSSFEAVALGSAASGFTQSNFGLSTGDLRGLGSSNILVLVNGRRQSSSALSINSLEAGNVGVNLSTVPFSAIERVEIVLDGASAIYGADAVGGVINFILRKNYEGGDIRAGYDYSKRGGDVQTYSGNYGTAWGTGNITLNGAYTKRDEVLSSDIGSTADLRPFGGVDHRTRFRFPTPIILSPRNGPPGLIRPDDTSRAPLTLNDTDNASNDASSRVVPFSAASELHRFGTVPRTASPENETISLGANIQQDIIADKLKAYGEVLYVDSESERLGFLTVSRGRYFVPETNAFNDTGQLAVLDRSIYGVLNPGLMPMSRSTNSEERLGLVGGFEYQLNEDWEFDASYTSNRSKTVSRSTNFELDDDLFQTLLESSDPNVAFNPFANGAGQNDLSSAFVETDRAAFEGRSNTNPFTSYERGLTAFARGKLWTLPAGRVQAVGGVEFRKDGYELNTVLNEAGTGLEEFSQFATSDPERDLFSVFGEMNVPLVSNDMNKRGIYSLEVNLSARYDDYTAEADTTLGNIDNRYRAFSPRVGAAWQPVETFKIRSSWSEAFRPPTLLQLFGRARPGDPNTPEEFYSTVIDPFLAEVTPSPNAEDAIANAPGVLLLNAPNPDLDPEKSEAWSLGFDWDPEATNFELSMNYNSTKIDGLFGNSDDILADPDLWLASGIGSNLGGAVVRNADGYITQVISTAINRDSSTIKSLDIFANYTLPTSFGEFSLNWSAAHSIKSEIVTLGVSERREGTDLGLPKWSHVTTLVWEKDALSLFATLDYTGKYTNSAAIERINDFSFLRAPDQRDFLEDQEIPSYTTFDLTGRYEFDKYGIILTAGATNIFGKDAPFYHSRNGTLFDPGKVDLRGSRLFFRVQKNF